MHSDMLQLGGRSIAYATKEAMLGDVSFFLVLLGWLGMHSHHDNESVGKSAMIQACLLSDWGMLEGFDSDYLLL